MVVTTAADDIKGSQNDTSLREAVKYSPAGTTITFAPALSGQTIRLTQSQILIANSITIDASALASPIILTSNRTGDGRTSDDSRVFEVDDCSLAVDSLIFANSTNNSTFRWRRSHLRHRSLR